MGSLLTFLNERVSSCSHDAPLKKRHRRHRPVFNKGDFRTVQSRKGQVKLSDIEFAKDGSFQGIRNNACAAHRNGSLLASWLREHVTRVANERNGSRQTESV